MDGVLIDYAGQVASQRCGADSYDHGLAAAHAAPAAPTGDPIPIRDRRFVHHPTRPRQPPRHGRTTRLPRCRTRCHPQPGRLAQLAGIHWRCCGIGCAASTLATATSHANGHVHGQCVDSVRRDAVSVSRCTAAAQLRHRLPPPSALDRADRPHLGRPALPRRPPASHRCGQAAPPALSPTVTDSGSACSSCTARRCVWPSGCQSEASHADHYPKSRHTAGGAVGDARSRPAG